MIRDIDRPCEFAIGDVPTRMQYLGLAAITWAGTGLILRYWILD